MANGQLDIAAVEAALADFPDPETGRKALQQEQIRDIRISGGELSLTLGLTTWSAPVWQDVEAALQDRVQSRLPQLTAVNVKRVIHERAANPLGEMGLRAKSVIAVGSGKGGVGKSTIAASLAVGLKRAGAKVGLMDADVYGPSIPHLFGVSGRPQIVDEKIQPVDADGMPLMSMGFMVPPGEAVVWRGPMLHGAITQFLRDTRWGELDYLIIDMPPGTGDIALTLSQLLPLTGAVVVCTPQEVALLDAVKAIAMFRKVNINVLGMVENMSGFLCPDCGKRYDIFGSGGARKKAGELDVPFLGEVPINMAIRELGDAGKTSASFDDPALAPVFDAISHRLVSNLANSAAAAPPMPQLPVL
ncbi:MAG: Mrp/NBP35 family ATP-binding protein [Planctomycetia bacterium]|nr:Mrp/NBP35 family ATP-binding protein [Planctomycetia bacterium]